MVVAVKVTGVCHSSHQKQLAVKVAEGGGLLEELDGMLGVRGGLQSPEEVAAVAKLEEEMEANTANLHYQQICYKKALKFTIIQHQCSKHYV